MLNSKLNEAFLTGIAGEVQVKPGVIRVSTLGGCLLHKAYAASTRTIDDVVEDTWSPLPAYLGKAYEKAVVTDIYNGAIPGLTYIVPEHEEGCSIAEAVRLVAGVHCDCQHKVNGDKYGLPELKGHLDGKVWYWRTTEKRERGGLAAIDVTSTTGEPALLEIKLLSPWSFRTFVQGLHVRGQQKSEPGIQNFPEYETQLHVYMGLANLPAAIFHMGTSYFKLIEKYDIEYPTATAVIPFNQTIFDRAMDRAEIVQKALNTGVAPRCERMKWCP